MLIVNGCFRKNSKKLDSNDQKPNDDKEQTTNTNVSDVRRGLFLSQKMHRSVTTNILLLDMFLRCDSINIGNYAILRITMALDRRWFFQVTAELQRMPIDKSAGIWVRRWCFFVYSTLLYFRVFIFCISAECPSRFFFFFEICGRIGNEMPSKRKFWSRKGGLGRTSVHKSHHTRRGLSSCNWVVYECVSAPVYLASPMDGRFDVKQKHFFHPRRSLTIRCVCTIQGAREGRNPPTQTVHCQTLALRVFGRSQC